MDTFFHWIPSALPASCYWVCLFQGHSEPFQCLTRKGCYLGGDMKLCPKPRPLHHHYIVKLTRPLQFFTHIIENTGTRLPRYDLIISWIHTSMFTCEVRILLFNGHHLDSRLDTNTHKTTLKTRTPLWSQHILYYPVPSVLSLQQRDWHFTVCDLPYTYILLYTWHRRRWEGG